MRFQKSLLERPQVPIMRYTIRPFYYLAFCRLDFDDIANQRWSGSQNVFPIPSKGADENVNHYHQPLSGSCIEDAEEKERLLPMQFQRLNIKHTLDLKERRCSRTFSRLGVAPSSSRRAVISSLPGGWYAIQTVLDTDSHGGPGRRVPERVAENTTS